MSECELLNNYAAGVDLHDLEKLVMWQLVTVKVASRQLPE